MIRVTWHYFDVDGNEISAEQWAASMVSGVIRSAIENYTYRAVENVSQMTCPVHGGKAELTFNVTGIPENPSIEIHVTGCCDVFAKKVKNTKEELPCENPDCLELPSPRRGRFLARLR